MTSALCNQLGFRHQSQGDQGSTSHSFMGHRAATGSTETVNLPVNQASLLETICPSGGQAQQAVQLEDPRESRPQQVQVLGTASRRPGSGKADIQRIAQRRALDVRQFATEMTNLPIRQSGAIDTEPGMPD